jgi:hypothetical protein
MNPFEARTLAADQFRIREDSDNAGRRMESPWYIRNLVSCEKSHDERFAALTTPSVAYPHPENVAQNITRYAEEAIETLVVDTKPLVDPACGPMCWDVRQAIVRLLLTTPLQMSGRWLDVSVASTGPDGVGYVIIPARKVKRILAHELTRLIGRSFDEQQDSWEINSDEVGRLMSGMARGPAAERV